LIRAQRTQIEELLAQLDRYRAAWRSARRRARTWRHEADQYQRVADACRRALYRDDVATDIDVEEEVRDAIAAVGIEWDTPHGETPADLVDAIVNHTRPALAKATEQRNRYRLAWRSARRRARRYRAERGCPVRARSRRPPRGAPPPPGGAPPQPPPAPRWRTPPRGATGPGWRGGPPAVTPADTAPNATAPCGSPPAARAASPASAAPASPS